MTDRESVEFAERLTLLAEALGGQLTPARVALYRAALDDLPFDRVREALNLSARTCKFFPKPVEVRELVSGNLDDRAESAWLTLWEAARRLDAYSSVRFEDGALGAAVRSVFIDWITFCSTERSPEMWASKRKEFLAAYRVHAQHEQPPVEFLGIFERENRLHGHEGTRQLGVVSAMHQIERVREPLALEEAEPVRGLTALGQTPRRTT